MTLDWKSYPNGVLMAWDRDGTRQYTISESILEIHEAHHGTPAELKAAAESIHTHDGRC